ncbi:glutaminase [Mycobacterium sp. NPDC003449]
MELQNLLDDIAGSIHPHLTEGRIADCIIPQLAAVEPNQFGISVATTDGEIYSAGQGQVPFSIQSISKVFALALVIAGDVEIIWKRVSREPSDNPFNSLVQLEQENGIPRNPFINAGALVVTDILLSATGESDVLDLLRRESDNNALHIDAAIAESEARNSHRNHSLAHFLATHGNLDNPVEHVVEAYISQCAIAASCTDLALASCFLAADGVGRCGRPIVDPLQTKRINALMTTCGTYDRAGEFAYQVGLPGKSGIGGGIVAVVPGVCTICVWSPRLGLSGNSIAGVAALSELTARTGWSIF